MVRATVIIVIISFILMKAATSVQAQTLKDQDWDISNIYGGTHPLLNDEGSQILIPTSNSIDLTLERYTNKPGQYTMEKTIGDDFGDYGRSTLLLYSALWTERAYISPTNFNRLYSTPFTSYLHNITGWQGCAGTKARNKRCSTPRNSFFRPPLDDGDAFRTNYIEHPLAGMTFYLYFRARGYDRLSAGVGSFLMSTLFEYTIEGWQQSPSFNDIIVTPGIGVPIGIILEETSNWLAESNNQFLRAMSYIVNPMRILLDDDKVQVANLRGVAFRFNLW